MTSRYSHCGLSVSDIGRTVRFYTEAFGFEVMTETLAVPPHLSQGRDFTVQFLHKDGLVLELMNDAGAPKQDPPARANYGLRHICVNVDSIDAVRTAVPAAGGTVIEGSYIRAELPGGVPMEVIFCLDPDGQTIELTTTPAEIARDYALLLQAKITVPG